MTKNSIEKSCLYVIASPIGNLSDITLRALDILKEVDQVFAEDTRVSKRLLTHLEIDKPIKRYDAHSHDRQIERILEALESGASIALMTDSGTPGISDPGFLVVNEVMKSGFKVVPIPGASSLTAAASASGINLRRFIFEGFLPKKKGRQTLLKKLSEEERPIILFESPHRVLKTLEELNQYLGDRYIVIARELTKMYEEIVRGKISEILSQWSDKNIKGEIVIIIDSNEK